MKLEGSMILQILTHVSEVVRKFRGELARGQTRDRARSTQPLQTPIETRVTEIGKSLCSRLRKCFRQKLMQKL